MTVSPSTLRRYRAERLLRQEFGGLREEVLRSVRGRLRARGVHFDGGDLEACYAQAWQGLYAAIAAGEEIANPGGWLAVVTFRRAIDEHRGARARGFGGLAQVELAGPEREVAGAAGAHIAHTARTEPDLAAELDDRARLRQLFEALRSRLSARECEAAALCYLQGLTRAQAARRMGISEARMTKLMEGRGAGSPGVAGKVGELLEAIRGGQWCEQQGSLMRGFAFGILDPRGERYRLARLHQRECPACRAYVLSLRGLAAVLPPLPLPWGLGFWRRRSRSTARPAGAAQKLERGPVPAGSQLGRCRCRRCRQRRLAAGRLGRRQAGGGVCAGAERRMCCPHGGAPPRGSNPSKPCAPTDEHLPGGRLGHRDGVPGARRIDHSWWLHRGALVRGGCPAVPRISPAARAAAVRRAAARHAQREFGLERPAATTATASSSPPPAPATARAASVQRAGATSAAESTSESAAAPTSTPSGPPSRAEREFGPE